MRARKREPTATEKRNYQKTRHYLNSSSHDQKERNVNDVWNFLSATSGSFPLANNSGPRAPRSCARYEKGRTSLSVKCLLKNVGPISVWVCEHAREENTSRFIVVAGSIPAPVALKKASRARSFSVNGKGERRQVNFPCVNGASTSKSGQR